MGLPPEIWADMLEDEGIDTATFRAAIGYGCADVSAYTCVYTAFNPGVWRWTGSGSPHWIHFYGYGPMSNTQDGDAITGQWAHGFVYYVAHQLTYGDGHGFAF